MKKNLFFAAVAAAVLATGCSNEKGTQSAGSDAGVIEFRGVVDKATRATAVGSTTELTNFFVHAGAHASATPLADLDFMEAVIYNDGGTWKYAPAKYYPSNGDEVDFYAYAPVKDVNMTAPIAVVSDKVQFGYTVPADQKVDNTAVDLLVASVLDKTDNGSDVAFTFDHALSAVTFSAANRNPVTGTGSELTYIISDIKITKMDNVGTFDYPLAADSWTPAGTRTGTYVAGLPEAGVSLEAIGSSATAQRLLSANDVMMVLPQEVTVGTLDSDGEVDENETFVEVTYSLKDGAGVPIFANEVRLLTLPAGFEFTAGTLYNFAFEFSAADAITFTVTALTGWGTEVTEELPQ